MLLKSILFPYKMSLVIVKVQLFGYVRDGLDRNSIEISLNEGSSLKDAISILKKTIPNIDLLRFAINTEYAEVNQKINQGDVISVIPPVQGG